MLEWGGPCLWGLGSLQEEEGHQETQRGPGGDEAETGDDAPNQGALWTAGSPWSCRRRGGSSPGAPPGLEHKSCCFEPRGSWSFAIAALKAPAPTLSGNEGPLGGSV